MARKTIGKYKKIVISISIDPEIKVQICDDLQKDGVTLSSWIESQIRKKLSEPRKR